MSLDIENRQPCDTYAWKVVVNNRYNPCSPFYEYSWSLGSNTSDRLVVDLTTTENLEHTVRQGFHLFASSAAALEAVKRRLFDHSPSRLRVLLLRVRPEHFVAAGTWQGLASAVYTQVENLGLYTGNA